MKTISLVIITLGVALNMGYNEFNKWNSVELPTDNTEVEVQRDIAPYPNMVYNKPYKVKNKELITVSATRNKAPRIVKTKRKFPYSKADEKCLAMNIFYEAGVERKVGQIAVAQVTLNRVAAKRWGDTICSVVYAKSQFSWTLYKNKRNVVPKGENWETAQSVAREVLNGTRVSTLDSGLYYHTNYIKFPKWAGAENKIDQIGQHLFYSNARLART